MWRLSASYWAWAGSASLAARSCAAAVAAAVGPAAAHRLAGQALQIAAVGGGSARAAPPAAELIGARGPNGVRPNPLQHRNRLPLEERGEQFSSRLRRFVRRGGPQRAGHVEKHLMGATSLGDLTQRSIP